MRFINKSQDQILLVFPNPKGWEIRIANDRGYEAINLTSEQVWQIVELIHDCESVKGKMIIEDNHERNMKEWTG